MNQAQLMAQVKKMQAEMAKAQEELANTIVSGSAAGGAVTVEVSCDQRVKRVRIGKEAVDPEDLETLEDLVTVAVNDALGKASEASQNRMASVTGGMRIPGLM
ncbi:MAG: YbaB/EbfC family nucleoid-associated protein [Candidatus Cybelea sp.]